MDLTCSSDSWMRLSRFLLSLREESVFVMLRYIVKSNILGLISREKCVLVIVLVCVICECFISLALKNK